MPPKKPTTPVSAHTHADMRANIPTEELRNFIADEERNPKTVLYPRDPSLDPQLVWKGKDEQDATDLAVPAVPVYIQEHIKPQNIVELVKANVAASPDSPLQPMLFGDFNGLDFAERVDFYHHEQHWTNRMILGDSLLVMTSLAEKEALKGKVQMIYFDPPYGIKFGSNWQVSTRKRDVKDGKAEDATRQPEQVKAFRDTWQLGIHSYLAYLRDRLVTARELLTESGSVFVQIGNENVHLVRNVLDEVFGSENFCGLIQFQKTSGAGSPAIGTDVLASVVDYIIWYAKDLTQVKYRQLYSWKTLGEEGTTQYVNARNTQEFTDRRLTADEISTPASILPDWRVFASDNLTSQSAGETTLFAFEQESQLFRPGKGGWKTNITGMQRLACADRLKPIGNTLMYRRYFSDFQVSPINNLWRDVLITGFSEDKVYVVQTSVKVIERCMLMTTDPGDLVLDPTCGSGTTAYVAEQWGRRWITIDTSRVSIALARTRLMAGRYPYYLLADSPDGKKKEQEINPQIDQLTQAFDEGETTKAVTTGDIRRGFVYKRVPHVTLKSIANNDEIDAIHEKYAARLEDLRTRINTAASKNWQEWEIPRDLTGLSNTAPTGTTQKDLSGLLAEYWQLRRERQREIDASIARRADVEMLYDQPYEDNKRLRVAGPFTVESLSPHRVLTTDDPATPQTEDQLNTHSFTQMILENLKSAGVQNTFKNERLKFSQLEPYPGTWLHATGEYTEKDGAARRVAVSVGPELGTVSADQVKEAAKEAVQGVGFDLLIICGFAFDPHVSEEAKRYGRLTVLPTRMNPDLAMGDELLKRTGAGNLFMVFGEPDVDIRQTGYGKVTVTINGVDVYDPTTGEIRSNKTDDIACWFIDTDYNEEIFIVRHAYFTGADEPYEKLKRALRSEIDESAWSALYSTTSYPFEKPKSGKIAVKVINHYGDEVLKVFEINHP